jgi:hypothetical protein
MRGMEHLIALRMRRQKPVSVLVVLHDRASEASGSESVLIPAATDSPGRADLRALLGLAVVVCGSPSQAGLAADWARAAESAGAAVVMAYATDSHRLKDKTPVYVGGDLVAIERRIADMETKLG